MSNNLTGDYDAVLLVSVTKINGILATLHQNGADPDASPVFPHSEKTRLGDPPKLLHPPLSDYAGWFNELLPAIDGGGDPGTQGQKLSDKAPPGAARILLQAYNDLQAARADEIVRPVPLNCRGTVEVQLSAPSIALPPGSTSEVTIYVNVRARFLPDPNTPALPEPIHGLVAATYSAKTQYVYGYGGRKTILQVEVPADDSKIQFTSAANTGLGPPDLQQIAIQIRKALREGFEPINVELPADFRFSQFKGLGNALALPLRLVPPLDLPASALGTVTNNFLNADFSIAISRDYFQTQFQPTIDNLMQFTQSFDVGYSIFTVTYHVSIKSVNLEWHDGYLDLVVKAKATASYAPDFDDITVRQRLTITVDSLFQFFFLRASDDDLSISGIWDFIKGRVRSGIISARDNALPPAQVQINNELTKNRTQINGGLSAIDDSASARFSAVRITPDGLILDGAIPSKFRGPPVVAFEETKDGTAFTAFESWIPGGRIDRFEWSWVKQAHLETIWGGEVVTALEDHRFLFPKPPQISNASQICLRIHGIQVNQQGFAIEIAGGTACAIPTPVVAWEMPSWSDPMPTPVWLPAVALDAVLEEQTIGHANVLAHARPGEAAANSVVHFADPKMDQPLEKFGKVLARRPGVPLVLIVVLPPKTFAGRRREVEAKLGSLGKEFNGHLILTEDYTGSWARTFDAKQVPSTYLMNTKGEFVWKQEGTFDADAIAAALEKYLTVPRAIRFRRLSLTTQPGERAPNTSLTDDTGLRLSLRKLRGQPILLNFFQAWSPPSIRELQRLQILQDKGGENAPVIVAVSGDPKADVLADVRRKYKLGFALVPDPNGSVARSFGVHCWPTTLSIAVDGRINGIQVGEQHDHGPVVKGPAASPTAPARQAS